MPQSTLICLLGGDTGRPIDVAKSLRPSRVILIYAGASMGPKAKMVEAGISTHFEQGDGANTLGGFRIHTQFVDAEETLLGWFRAIDVALAGAVQAVVDIDGAPALAAAAACLAAADRGACIVYGQMGGAVKKFSPGILIAEQLNDLDGYALEHLARGKSTLGETAEQLECGKSTASACLKRLRERGFVRRWNEGRDAAFELQDGVLEALPYILEVRGRK